MNIHFPKSAMRNKMLICCSWKYFEELTKSIVEVYDKIQNDTMKGEKVNLYN